MKNLKSYSKIFEAQSTNEELDGSFADYTRIKIPAKLLSDLNHVIKTTKEDTPYLTKLVSGDTSDLLEAYDEYREVTQNIQLPYEYKNRFTNWVISFMPNKIQQDFLAKYGSERIKKSFNSKYLNF